MPNGFPGIHGPQKGGDARVKIGDSRIPVDLPERESSAPKIDTSYKPSPLKIFCDEMRVYEQMYNIGHETHAAIASLFQEGIARLVASDPHADINEKVRTALHSHFANLNFESARGEQAKAAIKMLDMAEGIDHLQEVARKYKKKIVTEATTTKEIEP